MKKEEATAKREARLKAERARIESMKVCEREVLALFDPQVPDRPSPQTQARTDVLICGIDEAGRGPFAGPVVAGAVILDWDNPEKEILYLNASKKLSEKKREVLFREILSKALAVGIGSAGARIIDEINILQATYLAMRRAISNLSPVSHLVSEEEEVHDLVRKLVQYEITGPSEAYPVLLSPDDGLSAPDSDQNFQACSHITPDYILADAVHIPGIRIPQQGIIKGDARSISIAAGSIIAKVTRDHIMYEYDKQHPEYGFASHKGYGTARHIAAIREYGLLEIHRRSFIHL